MWKILLRALKGFHNLYRINTIIIKIQNIYEKTRVYRDKEGQT